MKNGPWFLVVTSGIATFVAVLLIASFRELRRIDAGESMTYTLLVPLVLILLVVGVDALWAFRKGPLWKKLHPAAHNLFLRVIYRRSDDPETTEHASYLRDLDDRHAVVLTQESVPVQKVLTFDFEGVAGIHDTPLIKGLVEECHALPGKGGWYESKIKFNPTLKQSIQKILGYLTT